MKTLLTLFGKGRSELESEIDKATSLKQVVKLVQNRVDGLEQNYIGELSVAQVRLVKFFLDTLRQSLSTLTAANEATVSEAANTQQIAQASRFAPKSLILKLLQGLIGVGILVSLFSLTQTDPEAWMTILLMSLLVGLEVALQLDKDKDDLSPPQPVTTPQLPAQVDSKVLLDNLAEALNTIDRAVAQAKEVQKPFGPSGIEEMPDVLDFLQKLLGASFVDNPQMSLELTKIVPQILMEQGIRVQNYRPNDPLSERSYFDFEPSIIRSAKDYVTITPALLKGDRVLRKGRVIEPAGVKDRPALSSPSVE